MDRVNWQPEIDRTNGDVDRLPNLSFDEVVAQSARLHGISVGELLSRSRDAHYVRARAEAYVVLRGQGWSYPSIGRAFKRDHTTILSAVRKAIGR